MGSWQGPHHVAQNSRNTTRPRNSLLRDRPAGSEVLARSAGVRSPARGHAERESLAIGPVLDGELADVFARDLHCVFTVEGYFPPARNVSSAIRPSASSFPRQRAGDRTEEACTTHDKARRLMVGRWPG